MAPRDGWQRGRRDHRGPAIDAIDSALRWHLLRIKYLAQSHPRAAQEARGEKTASGCALSLCSAALIYLSHIFEVQKVRQLEAVVWAWPSSSARYTDA